MRSIFSFIILISVVLVPWGSLAPALLQDASGSAISTSKPAVPLPPARLVPDLGILPITAQDEANEQQPAAAFTDSSDTRGPRMICENGVCRLVDYDVPESSVGAAPELAASTRSSHQKLEAIGATQIRVEVDSQGDWRCSCSIPLRPGSPIMRRFEGSGKSDEQAIQEAYRLIEVWLQEHR
jgi:hypothetical protein